MKKTLKLFIAIMVVSLLACLFLVACDEEKPCETHVDDNGDNVCDVCGTTLTNENPDNGNNGGGSTDTVTKLTYTVKVTTKAGRPMEGVTASIYTDTTFGDLETFGDTNASGLVTFSLPSSSKYAIKLSRVPVGYKLDDYYQFDNRVAEIKLESSVIDDTNLSGVQYKLGDVMRDFTVTTTEDKEFTLSKVLEDKDFVLINFWYTTCSWCIEEFPYMDAVYEEYADKIAIIALDPYQSDSIEAIKIFKADMELSFDVAKDTTTLSSAFNVTGFPTSVGVDRYGVVCFIESGGILSEKPFRAMFDHFTAANYEQKLLNSIDELTPIEKPNVTMPTSAEISTALNADATGATFYAESGRDAEYAWPFVVGDKDGACIKASNSYRDSSYAIMHFDINLNEGQAVKVEYFSSTERGADLMYVIVNDDDIYTIGGVSEAWANCYLYVADETAKYTVSLIYLKDGDTDVGDDTIYLRNLSVVDSSAIDTKTHIPRYCATDKREDGSGFDTYITPVLNPEDGYFHVNTADGPLVLVDLMGYTQFSNVTSVYECVYNNQITIGGVSYNEAIMKYCGYSGNSDLFGITPVTEELRDLLVKFTDVKGFDDDENEWLQLCKYYEAYGTNGVELEDPIKGLATFSAFDTIINEAEDPEDYFPNSVTYHQIIMPRGYWFKVQPTVSGVYKILTDSKSEVDGWIFDGNGEQILEFDHIERITDYSINNVKMLVYMEAGETYYVDVAYYDVYETGTIPFQIVYVGETLDVFRYASPAVYTYHETADGSIGAIVAGGVTPVYNEEDGYYHAGSKDGSILYADFTMIPGIFNKNIVDMIKMGGFDFSKDEEGNEVAGKEDKTEAIRAYLDDIIDDTKSEDFNLYGCVAVDKELAELLLGLMYKYSFENVAHSWTKLCYYYETLGPEEVTE